MEWGSEEAHELRLECDGPQAIAYLDGKEVLRSSAVVLEAGGAGYLVQTGNAGFGETTLAGYARLF